MNRIVRIHDPLVPLKVLSHLPSWQVALLTWAWWFPLISVQGRWGDFLDHFPMTLTMIAGSFIAGATSEGGGAVAFPVLTLAFNVSPAVARDFALMIQAVGMTAASVVIIRSRIPVAWEAVGPVSLGGVLGILGGLTWVAPILPAPMIKIFFCCLWLSFAVALHLVSLRHNATLTDSFTCSGSGFPSVVLVGVGVLGGVVSSLVGSGLDIVTFAFLTLIARLSERVATPTSVVLMAGNALVGFFWQGTVRGAIAAESWSFWYVCVPVVVVGAPLGTRFIRHRSSAFIRRLLYVCIGAQFFGAVLILPFSPALLLVGSGTFAAGTGLFLWLGWQGSRRRAVAPPAQLAEQRRAAWPDPGP